MKLRKVLKGVLNVMKLLFVVLKYVVGIIFLLYYCVALICFMHTTYEVFYSISHNIECDTTMVLYAISSTSMLIIAVLISFCSYLNYKREEQTCLHYKSQYNSNTKYKEKYIALQEENLELRDKLIEAETEIDLLKRDVFK